MSAKFLICRHCGNLVGVIDDHKVPMMCCGQKMEVLVPNTTDAAGEKHLPVVTVEDGAININVGEVTHPMTAEHYITWIYVETDKGGHRRALSPDDEPNITIALPDEKPLAVYAYCNLHGLWMTEIK